MSGHRFQALALPGNNFDGRPEWHEQAACRGAGPDLFFDPSRFDEARRTCVGCPVLDRCGEQGRQEMFGLWGANPAGVKRRNGYIPRGQRPMAPCGTDAAYKRHLRHGEVPCDSCREAHNVSVAHSDRRLRRTRRSAA